MKKPFKPVDYSSSPSRGPADRRMLRALLERDDLRDADREAFESMLASLDDYDELTFDQRAWVQRASGETAEGDYVNLVSSGAVSSKTSVETLPMLRPENLPKKPPPRRKSSD